ncbi:MAG: YggS family pyridoxal phosphate-dependent enzyme [Clostridiales Family XIII bacterium]|jgi:pyridoxal phosphate enzyme (YggS family)|nr:YggS family pyridoxal phosphate-dependent enzyme [Clostridiales Family XIII bacterium]
MSIETSIEALRGRIGEYARLSGRDPGEVLMIAVTKTRSPDEINRAIAAGVTDIGENKVQEIVDKHGSVNPVNWHMIGHLQRNKVKYIIDKVRMVHSVDSLRLAEEIDARAAQRGLAMDILIQVNAAGEESKFGVGPEGAGRLVGDILEGCGSVNIRGLMFIAPAADDPEGLRPCFRKVKSLYDELGRRSHERLDFRYLSMGMSHDFGAAIMEGSNVVRIGTAIFGDRA